MFCENEKPKVNQNEGTRYYQSPLPLTFIRGHFAGYYKTL